MERLDKTGLLALGAGGLKGPAAARARRAPRGGSGPLEINEINGELIGELYEAMPDDIQRRIRLAAGALLWRRSAAMMAERHPQAFAARAIAWAVLTDRGETTLRQAHEGIMEAGGMIKSAALLVGAFDEAKAKEYKRHALASAELILAKGANEDVTSWLDRIMGEDEGAPAWLERGLDEGDENESGAA